MIDRSQMRLLLENMEQAAQETLQQSATFFEAVQALKNEIDHDAQVQETVKEMQASGRSVFNSFVPHIKIRVRTDEGIFSLPKQPKNLPPPPADPMGQLTQQLRSAASVVIRNSRHFRELEGIVNEAVSGSERFEGIALEIERAGYEVLICLDLSAYVEVRGSAAAQRTEAVRPSPTQPTCPTPTQRMRPTPTQPTPPTVAMPLSGADRKFLKGIGISLEGC